MPHRVECQNNIGMVYEKVGKLDEAIDAYTLAYGMNDKNAVVIGNLARAHIRRGDSGPEIQKLLDDLRLYDDRRDWVAWANERLALGKPRAADSSTSPRHEPSAVANGERLDEATGEGVSSPVPELKPAEELPPPRNVP